MRSPARFAVLTVAAALAVAPLPAAVYTVELTNGTSVLTRYEPEDAAWDSSKIVFVDEYGNTVAFDKSDVVGVTSDFESKGYGSMIDSTTMALGWAPNDALDPASPEGQAAAAAAAVLGTQPPPAHMDNFVEPSATQGMPAGWVGLGSTYFPQPMMSSPPPVLQAPPPPVVETLPGDSGQ